jgi:hypothetical protein
LEPFCSQVKKGITIEKFLGIVQREFHDLRGVSVESLMFIKEDLIIPHVSLAIKLDSILISANTDCTTFHVFKDS